MQGADPIPRIHQEKRARVGSFFGGSEGNRTPVRKPLDITFSVGSPFFQFPRKAPKGRLFPQRAILCLIGSMANRRCRVTAHLTPDESRGAQSCDGPQLGCGGTAVRQPEPISF